MDLKQIPNKKLRHLKSSDLHVEFQGHIKFYFWESHIINYNLGHLCRILFPEKPHE